MYLVMMTIAKWTIHKRFFWIAAFSYLNWLPYAAQGESTNLVRVAIVCGVDSVTVSGMAAKKYYENYRVCSNASFPFYLHPKDGMVVVNNRAYRGSLEIRKMGKQLWVINVVAIEDYLKGVVPCEIGSITPNLIEVAKAQAVAARTYAYANRKRYQHLGFDLYSTMRDQVYNGIQAEDELINIAIKKTAGKILVYQGRPVETKYHSTCGGRTADFSDAWPGTGPAYLRSVHCPYCKTSPHYEWRKVFSKADFFKNLRTRVSKLGLELQTGEYIKAFKLIRNRRSQRVSRVIIRTDRNEYRIEADNIRTLFGSADDPNGLLKSNYINLQAEKDSIIIEGRGFGHGVGLCQFGAIEMARQGKNYRQILYHYYPGTKLRRSH